MPEFKYDGAVVLRWVKHAAKHCAADFFTWLRTTENTELAYKSVGT